jgi:hypothetical protein
MPLSALESTLTAWLREQLPLPASVGDISFDSPDEAWAGALTRPTVNLFLFDIARAARPAIPIPPRRDPGGVLLQERPAPCVSFSYLLSVWGQDVQEEHRLLGDAVRAVLSTSSLSPDPESPEHQELVGPVQLGLSEPNEVRAAELWSGLGGRLRAGMVLVATTAVPLGRPRPLAAAVETVRAEVTPKAPGERAISRAASRAASRATTKVEGSVVEDAPPRRFVWFGPRQQRGQGRP